jgi:hypothetical protein
LIIVIVWLMVTISLNVHEAVDQDAKWAGILILILALGAVSIKLSAVPILAISMLYYLFAQRFSLRKVYMAALPTVLFIAILMWINTITSGCLLFPVPYFCLDLPWSVGSALASAVSDSITLWARWGGVPPLDADNFNWIWSKWVYKEKTFFRFLIVNIICILWLYFKRNRIRKDLLIYPSLVALAGITFSIITSPSLRFVQGYLVVIPALTGMFLLQESHRINHALTIFLHKLKAPLLFMLITAYIVFTPALNIPNLRNHFILPSGLPSGNVQSAQVNNLKYYYPTDSDQCWAAKLPCVPTRIDKNISLRDEKAGLNAGFYKIP